MKFQPYVAPSTQHSNAGDSVIKATSQNVPFLKPVLSILPTKVTLLASIQLVHYQSNFNLAGRKLNIPRKDLDRIVDQVLILFKSNPRYVLGENKYAFSETKEYVLQQNPVLYEHKFAIFDPKASSKKKGPEEAGKDEEQQHEEEQQQPEKEAQQYEEEAQQDTEQEPQQDTEQEQEEESEESEEWEESEVLEESESQEQQEQKEKEPVLWKEGYDEGSFEYEVHPTAVNEARQTLKQKPPREPEIAAEKEQKLQKLRLKKNSSRDSAPLKKKPESLEKARDQQIQTVKEEQQTKPSSSKKVPQEKPKIDYEYLYFGGISHKNPYLCRQGYLAKLPPEYDWYKSHITSSEYIGSRLAAECHHIKCEFDSIAEVIEKGAIKVTVAFENLLIEYASVDFSPQNDGLIEIEFNYFSAQKKQVVPTKEEEGNPKDKVEVQKTESKDSEVAQESKKKED